MKFFHDIQLLGDFKVTGSRYMDSQFLTEIDKILNKLLKEEVAYFT